MACFTAVAVEAIAATVVKKHVQKKECAKLAAGIPVETEGKISWSRKLGWLTNLLWGGAFLLLIEHIWHGEVVPWFPFLTAVNNPADTAAMLREIATVGTAMCVVVTLVWFVAVLVVDAVAARNARTENAR